MEGNKYKAPIYKAVVFSFGVMLAGQYARYATHAFMPQEDNTVAPFPMEKPALTVSVHDINPSCEGDARQPLFLPCGRKPFDPPVSVPIKPTGE